METLFTTLHLKRNEAFNFKKGIVRFLICILISISQNGISQVYINEIMVNPAGANDGSNMPNTSEWIEFYNGGATSVNIGCWFFTDGDFAVTFPSGATIPAGGYYTVASAAGSGLTPSLNWATCGCTTNNPGNNGSLSGNQVGIFTNGSEQVLLYNSSGVLQDAIIWGGGQLTTALTLTIATVGVCASQVVTIPTNTVNYENIGTNSDGISKERDYDGSPTWQNAGSGTFAGTNAVVLPIELVSFNAEPQKEQVMINWQTASELNNDYFTLEKSKDGIDFESFYIVKGKGNSTIYNSYSAVDEKPFNGITYYRLKQTDLDGSFTYSQIIPVESDQVMDIDLFPNPTNNGHVYLRFGNDSEASMQIIDAYGNMLLKETVYNGKNEIDLCSFGKGLYIVIAESKEKIITKKIIYN